MERINKYHSRTCMQEGAPSSVARSTPDEEYPTVSRGQLSVPCRGQGDYPGARCAHLSRAAMPRQLPLHRGEGEKRRSRCLLPGCSDESSCRVSLCVRWLKE